MAVLPRVAVYMSPLPRYAPLVDSIGVRSRTALGLLSHGIRMGDPSGCGEHGSGMDDLRRRWLRSQETWRSECLGLFST
jgi:hypothetical protein